MNILKHGHFKKTIESYFWLDKLTFLIEIDSKIDLQ